MNKVFRLVWSRPLQAYVAASEHASVRGKLASTRSALCGAVVVLGGCLLLDEMAIAAPPVDALPTGGQVIGGPTAGTIATTSNVMTVTQHQQRLITNWDTFNVGNNAQVNFVQPSSSAAALNRVVGSAPSEIFGRLSANGQVMLINPAGIVFGPNSQVNTAGLVASSLAISDANFNAGKYSFRNDSNAAGRVINQGKLTVNDGGLVALIAPVVKNEGQINSPQGTTLLAAGRAVDVDLQGDGLINYRISADAAGALVDNSGSISAAGGLVVLSAPSAIDALSQAVVNNDGVVSAQSLQSRNGRIVLSGGSVTNNGVLDVAAHPDANGGSIQISGDFVALGGVLDADGNRGGEISVDSQGVLSLADQIHANGNQTDGGRISYKAGGRLIENVGSRTEALGARNGGIIGVNAERIFSSGVYKVDGAAGLGGRIDMTAAKDVNLFSAHLSATGASQGGLIRIGGPFQGGKNTGSNTLERDRYDDRWRPLPQLGHAQTTLLNDSTTLAVSATQGEGGTAIIWSDEQTTFLGRINATGSRGGAVEISSAKELRRADLFNIDLGLGGQLLLDPQNIVIGSAPAQQSWVYSAVLGVAYANQTTTPPAVETGDTFGYGVALNAIGNRLAVGAPSDDGNGNAVGNSGAAYLFSFADTNFSGATLQATLGKGYSGGKNLDVAALEANDRFGYQVSLNAAGDRLAVSAPLDDGSGNAVSNSGAAYLFSFTDTNFSGGTLQATLGKGYSGGKNVNVAALEANDNFGYGLSLNAAGDRLAFGAPFDDGSGNALSDSGAAYLFNFSDTNFSSGALQATVGKGYSGGKNINVAALEASDNFGYGVSLNAAGDRLVAGAPFDDGSGNAMLNSGAAYLFSFGDTNFSTGALEATLGKGYSGGKSSDVSVLDLADYFGTSVSLNAAGDRLAVGAMGDYGNPHTSSGAGAAYLFSFGDTSFSGALLEAKLAKGATGSKNVDIAQLASSDFFGASVSLNALGNRLAVSAPNELTFGRVYLFSFSDNNFSDGTMQATLGRSTNVGKDVNLTALETSDNFGYGVSLNAMGDRLAVGAPLDDGSGNAASNSGAAYLFSFTDTNFSGGALQATLGKGYSGGKNINVAALEASDGFGYGVSLNAAGDRLAVGAPFDDGSGNAASNSGAAYLFSFTDTNFSGGTFQATLGKGYSGGKNLDVAALEANDNFGYGLSLSAAADRLAVGAPFDDGSGNTVSNSGAAYLFNFTDTNFSGGALQATVGKNYSGGKNVNAAGLEANDNFGYGVSLNAAGDRLAAGAPLDDGSGNVRLNSGAAYLFSFTDTNFSGGALQATLGRSYSGGKNIGLALNFSESFGRSISLNALGDRLAVGSPNGFPSGGGSGNYGAAYLFSFTDTTFSGGALQATLGKDYRGGKNLSVTSLEAGDFFGQSLSLNAAGDRLAVGASGDAGSRNGATGSGATYLFSFTDTSFSGGLLQASIGNDYLPIDKNVTATALEANDNFGASVALNAAGDRLAVGAPNDAGSSNAASGSGAAYLFSFTDSIFSGGALQATLGKGYSGGKNVDVAVLEAGDKFGAGLSLNAAGDRLAIGAPSDAGSGNAASGSGAAYLFSFTDSLFSGGALQATLGKGYVSGKNLDIAALHTNDGFGNAVSLNAAGDRLAVGAPNDAGSASATSGSGAAYLFSFADTNFSGGTLQAKLGKGYGGGKNVDVAVLEAGDKFGAGLSLNAAGDRLAIGAPSDAGNGNAASGSGAAYLFSFTDSLFSGGALQATLGKSYAGSKNIDLTPLDANDNFGTGISLNAIGDRLAVGSPGDDGNGNSATDSGAAYLFSFTDANFSGGTLQTTLGKNYSGVNVGLTALGAGDNFGGSVSFNAAGDRLAVGVANDDGRGNAANDSGAVYLFRLNSISSSASPLSDGTSFSTNSGQSVNLLASDIQAQLSTGASLTLQASNDITLNSAITANNVSGNGGAFKLQAGRSIVINASIVTDNGDLSLIANESLSNGVVDMDRVAGAAVITTSSGTVIDAGSGTVSFLISDGAGKTNASSGNITLGSTINAGMLMIDNHGPTAGSGVVLGNSARLNAIGTGTALSLRGSTFTNNAGPSALSASNGRWLVWSDNPAADDRGGLVYDFKQYNAVYGTTTPADSIHNGFLYTLAPTLSASLIGTVSKIYDGTVTASVGTGNLAATGTVDSDTVYLSAPSAASYLDKNAGLNKTVSATGIALSNASNAGATVYGYQLGNSNATGAVGLIAPRALMLSGLTADSKVYDGSRAARVDNGSVQLTGLVNGDDFQVLAAGEFDTKNVGVGKAVSLTETYGGADANNYLVTGQASTTADILPKTLTVNGTTAANKLYDGNTIATLTLGSLDGLVNSERLDLQGSASFDTANPGLKKQVTVTYTLGDDINSGGLVSNYQISNPSTITTADITSLANPDIKPSATTAADTTPLANLDIKPLAIVPQPSLWPIDDLFVKTLPVINTDGADPDEKLRPDELLSFKSQ